MHTYIYRTLCFKINCKMHEKATTLRVTRITCDAVYTENSDNTEICSYSLASISSIYSVCNFAISCFRNPIIPDGVICHALH